MTNSKAKVTRTNNEPFHTSEYGIAYHDKTSIGDDTFSNDESGLSDMVAFYLAS